MASECSTSFAVNFILNIEADVTFESASVGRVPGFVSKWAWVIYFTYVTGDPPATGFRLDSADGLSGRFSHSRPRVTDNSLEVHRNNVFGIITLGSDVHIPPEGINYNGTVVIIQE